MNDVITMLIKNNGRMKFTDTIIRSGSRPEMIAAFLAILELIKLQRIAIAQQVQFGPIYLMLRGEYT
ncbi:Segregation and condensation protein A [bioreactor metagenome]|uniref:Segregation and condensation protein A n=1 Tax=bioreactor metagenome TaxID=1076179 RepID=A0A645BUS3_9ZZZZ